MVPVYHVSQYLADKCYKKNWVCGRISKKLLQQWLIVVTSMFFQTPPLLYFYYNSRLLGFGLFFSHHFSNLEPETSNEKITPIGSLHKTGLYKLVFFVLHFPILELTTKMLAVKFCKKIRIRICFLQTSDQNIVKFFEYFCAVNLVKMIWYERFADSQHTETSQSIWSANQMTVYYMLGSRKYLK